MEVIIDKSIGQIIPGCRLGCLRVNGVTIKGTSAALTQEFMELQAKTSEAYNLDILPKLPRIVAVRNMYRKMRIDPSRHRPASEKLIRRVLQDKGLYYINSAVDVGNYCSLKFLVPFGLYDADQIDGTVSYRLAEEGTYVNTAGLEASTEGKPFLTDAQGVFGNPTADSQRTAVTLSTQNLFVVVYADEEVELAQVLDFTGDMLIRYNGGVIADKFIVQDSLAVKGESVHV